MKWHNRSFISFLLVWSFAIVCVSGIVLYITPHGRVAYWVNWRYLGLTKNGWAAVHTIVSYLFIICSAIHIIYNFRILTSYLKEKTQAGKRHLFELLLSIILIFIVVGATIGGFPPFSSIMNLGESFKESWIVVGQDAPIPHAELMTIKQFSESMGFQIESVIEILSNHGIYVDDSDVTLKSIAQKYNMSPAGIYMIIQPHREAGQEQHLQQGIRKYRNRIR